MLDAFNVLAISRGVAGKSLRAAPLPRAGRQAARPLCPSSSDRNAQRRSTILRRLNKFDSLRELRGSAPDRLSSLGGHGLETATLLRIGPGSLDQQGRFEIILELIHVRVFGNWRAPDLGSSFVVAHRLGM